MIKPRVSRRHVSDVRRVLGESAKIDRHPTTPRLFVVTTPQGSKAYIPERRFDYVMQNWIELTGDGSWKNAGKSGTNTKYKEATIGGQRVFQKDYSGRDNDRTTRDALDGGGDLKHGASRRNKSREGYYPTFARPDYGI